MERVIDHTKYQAHGHVDSIRSLLFIKPFTFHHIQTLENTFNGQKDTHYWCGYTIIENIPPSLESIIIPVNPEEPCGAILFSNTAIPLQLLFQDLRKNFYLTHECGSIISVNKTIEEALTTLQRRNN